MDIKIIYEDGDLIVVDKPAGLIVFEETNTKIQDTNTIIDLLLKKYSKLVEVGEAPRYGVVHRLDKDTSGVLLVAKSNESLIFFQKQFINRTVEKKYIALVCGTLKDDLGSIETLIGRSPADPRKQKAYPLEYKGKTGLREAITEYKVLERFAQFTLLEVSIKTGRKHQIRCHMAHIHHPIVGDKVYGFKDSPTLEGLKRQFLHASYLKIELPTRNNSDIADAGGKIREFMSDLPSDLEVVIKNLKNL